MGKAEEVQTKKKLINLREDWEEKIIEKLQELPKRDRKVAYYINDAIEEKLIKDGLLEKKSNE